MTWRFRVSRRLELLQCRLRGGKMGVLVWVRYKLCLGGDKAGVGVL